MSRFSPALIIPVVVVALAVAFGSRLWRTVPPGHVAVATLFGEVQSEPFAEGLNVPVNPFYKWVEFDVRQKTHMESASVPSQDQLQTRVDVSIQYRLIGSLTPSILKETGRADDVRNVHIVPKLRSVVREQGKSIKRAEDFFLETTQDTLQARILEELRSYLQPKGVEVSAVLLRDINLPPFITKAIEQKKEREQEVEKQKAELERFRTEQQQKIAAAQAEREAAEEEAARRRLIADAQAYEIEKINTAIGSNPNYVKLQALKALEAISKDPASKVYFIDGDSPQPLPLMHMGDTNRP